MSRVASVVLMTSLLIAAGGRPLAWAAPGPPVAPTTGADLALMLKINDALRQDHYLDYRDVRAEARSGEAVLTGTVLTDFEKAHAAKVAGGVPGVKAVKNQILVVRDVAGGGSDLAKRVRDFLHQWDPNLHVTALAIETEAPDAIVLNGIVASSEAKTHIGEAAAKVAGVSRVVNNLEVEPAT
jgi:osmotically-inducible protein OsmY